MIPTEGKVNRITTSKCPIPLDKTCKYASRMMHFDLWPTDSNVGCFNHFRNFQSFDNTQPTPGPNYGYPPVGGPQGYYDPTASQAYTGEIFTPDMGKQPAYNPVGSNEFDDEPPLLEELGINPNHIMQKVSFKYSTYEEVLFSIRPYLFNVWPFDYTCMQNQCSMIRLLIPFSICLDLANVMKIK